MTLGIIGAVGYMAWATEGGGSAAVVETQGPVPRLPPNGGLGGPILEEEKINATYSRQPLWLQRPRAGGL